MSMKPKILSFNFLEVTTNKEKDNRLYDAEKFYINHTVKPLNQLTRTIEFDLTGISKVLNAIK